MNHLLSEAQRRGENARDESRLGLLVWRGSDNRQSGWGNLVFIDNYDAKKHRTDPRYLK